MEMPLVLPLSRSMNREEMFCLTRFPRDPQPVSKVKHACCFVMHISDTSPPHKSRPGVTQTTLPLAGPWPRLSSQMVEEGLHQRMLQHSNETSDSNMTAVANVNILQTELSNQRFCQDGNNIHSLARIAYLDHGNLTRMWDNDDKEVKVDNVAVMAFYRRMLHYDCIVLVKQYRPAINTYTIEMPSCKVEENETVSMIALQEIKLTTGFSATVKKIGPVLAADPSTSDSSVRLVTVEINGDDPMNLQVKLNNNKGQFKEALLVPVSELLEKLSAFARAGFIIDSRIDAFAIGLVMGNQSRKMKTPTSMS